VFDIYINVYINEPKSIICNRNKSNICMYIYIKERERVREAAQAGSAGQASKALLKSAAQNYTSVSSSSILLIV